MQYVSEDQHWAMILCILHKLCSLSSPKALNLQLALLCNLLQIPAQVRGRLEKGSSKKNCRYCTYDFFPSFPFLFSEGEEHI